MMHNMGGKIEEHDPLCRCFYCEATRNAALNNPKPCTEKTSAWRKYEPLQHEGEAMKINNLEPQEDKKCPVCLTVQSGAHTCRKAKPEYKYQTMHEQSGIINMGKPDEKAKEDALEYCAERVETLPINAEPKDIAHAIRALKRKDGR